MNLQHKLRGCYDHKKMPSPPEIQLSARTWARFLTSPLLAWPTQPTCRPSTTPK